MAAPDRRANPSQIHLSPGQYYGEILDDRRCCDLVLTEVKHIQANRFPKHSHELAFFSLLLDGSYTERCGPKTVDYKQLMVVYRPSGVTHSDRIGDSGVRLFNVEIKESWLERMRQHGPIDHLSLEPFGGELAWLAARLYREFRENDPYGPLAIEGLILEMLATMNRNSSVIDRRPPPWLAKVRDLLHAEYADGISIARISTEVGVHPYELSRAFRKFQRQTIAEFVQELRVKQASIELLQPEMTLADIALSAGFADQSHLTRIFKRVTGMTPGAFRSALVRTPGSPSPEPESAPTA
jgi:AraC family transcriptional regulator